MSVYDDPPSPIFNRNAVIALGVVVFHALALWGLQSGLLRRAVEIVLPVQLVAEFIDPPRPREVPPPVPTPTTKPVATTPTRPVPVMVPQPIAINDPSPSPNAPSGVATPVPLPSIAAPVAAVATAAPVQVARPTPPRVELPSSDADYLQNPKPPYPRLSKRLNEQGTVVMRVLIGSNGEPMKAEIGKSSGFDRLDESAATTVMKWRYVPGKRGGVAEAMWFNVPINFVLE
ncbi:MAG TPA: energy transducer TonB [Casimicrobium sp.]|nr:energy transducer TonB [Casimicrobium sp.]